MEKKSMGPQPGFPLRHPDQLDIEEGTTSGGRQRGKPETGSKSMRGK